MAKGIAHLKGEKSSPRFPQLLAVASELMLSEDEKKAKENALSGLTGGSFSEIVTLLLVVPVRSRTSHLLRLLPLLPH